MESHRGSSVCCVCAQLLHCSPAKEQSLLLCFFFQAEDGIRDVAVTGVQTCALPIWIAAFTQIVAMEMQRYGVTVNAIAPGARTRMTERTFGELRLPDGQFDALAPENVRSEERRVGKECRSRWSPYH